MKFLSLRCAGLASAGLLATAAFPSAVLAETDEPALQDVIIITTNRSVTEADHVISPQSGPYEGGDLTYLLARTPGGARIGNGDLSGQMQYRGLFGERLNLRVDGQRFASGGPNLMDPVFHYAPTALVSTVIIDRGVSPVSEGPGLAGGADAVFKRVDYAGSGDLAFGHDVTIGSRSINESVEAGGVVGVATDTWRANLLGSWEDGDDTQFANGAIAGSGFERGVFGLSSGVKLGDGELTLDLRRQNTGPSGNPPFPMDIIYFDTDFARIGYRQSIGAAVVEASLHFTDVAHLMNNFGQRPAPPVIRQRATFADATTQGAELSVEFDSANGTFLLGLDGDTSEHDVTITNPDNADFFVTPFPDVELSRFGGFAEWAGGLGPVQGELGLRIDQHEFEGGEANLGPALPMGPRMLAGAFNEADRSGEETTIHVVARFWTQAQNGLSWRGTLAHKQQMPGYIQRYGWLPINASGGLADGNIYIGDLTLEPDTALIAEAGFDYASSRAYLRPTVFIREIDDYIHGMAFDDTIGIIDSPVEMIASMNGDPTPLQWTNVDARLYGFDLDAGFDFDGPLRMDAVLSYVHGERRDIDDNLYRVAPPNLSVGLTWEADVWSATFEARGVAEQSDVSETNGELESSSYAVANLYADWQVRPGMGVSAGIENVFDTVYRDHLSGVNRNWFGDVAVGARVPGAGRGMFIRVNFTG